MKKKKVLLDGSGNEITVVKKSSRRVVVNVIYYTCGAVLSLFFLFPLIYMLAVSTKSDASIAASAGTLEMFLPDFKKYRLYVFQLQKNCSSNTKSANMP